MTSTEDRELRGEDHSLVGDEIDLREIVQVVVNRWPWIVLTTLVATLLAAGYSFFVLSPSYQATALVAITPPKYVMQLSPGFETVAQERIQTEIYGTYPELAKSDELLQEVVATVNETSDGSSLGLVGLRNMVAVQGSKDVGLIYLRATSSDRKLTAVVVNTWAELYVSTLNRLYGGEAGDYEFFAAQMAAAKEDLDAAQAALVEFKARDRSSVLQRRLSAAEKALVDRLDRQDQVDILLEDIQGWQQQLVLLGQGQGYTLSLADELTAILVQLKAFNLQASEPQLQVAIGQVDEGRDLADQLAALDSLGGWLLARSDDLDTQIAELEPEILRLQEDLQEVSNEEMQLRQQVDLATSLYESLALKAEESRIALESEAGVGRLASRAAVPTRPVGPRKLFNTLAGAGMGLLAGFALAVFREFVSRSRQTTESGN